jgi:hypothetical protein
VPEQCAADKSRPTGDEEHGRDYSRERTCILVRLVVE